MPKVTGLRNTSFKSRDDGSTVEGKTVYLSDDIPASVGSGQSTERYFLSQAKLDSFGFALKVGMDVRVLFNRFGKVATIELLNDLDEYVDV